MAAKRLITKGHDPADARVTVVSLTEQGRESIREIEGELYRQTGLVIDRVGEERVLEFMVRRMYLFELPEHHLDL